jgi:uncharacterized protein YraI
MFGTGWQRTGCPDRQPKIKEQAMMLRTKFLAAGAALLLSTGAALAVPATAQTDLNVRSGPGTNFPVVGSIQGGETVDAGSCTGGWCRVSFSGGSGFASRNYLAMGGAAPGPAVAATPYVYDEPYYDYYDYGYAYGPSAFIYANPRFRHRHHGWHGRPGWNGGNWAGRPGRPGGTPPVAGQPRGSGFAGPPANWQRPGTGIGAAGGARVGGSGFAGPRGGGSGFAGGGGFSGGAPAAAAPAAPAGGGGAGFAGSMVRGGR